jgi:hypothetical protein
MSLLRRKSERFSFLDAFVARVTAVACVVVFLSLGYAHAAAVDQRQYGTPEEAVKALLTAIKANDTLELLAIFGPAGKMLIFSGDRVADEAGRERFAKAYQEMNQLETKDEKRVILHVGSEDWPFPVPIVKQGNWWSFNTNEGKEEILNRRIGKNELDAVQVCLAVVDAQVEYGAKDRDGDGVLEYAQKLVSEKDQKDGLYWYAKEDDEPSPLGPLAAKAGVEGYGGKHRNGKPEPYHGYFFRILKEQGRHAPGGARNYLVKGNMIGGFAVVAYPAVYGNSGIVTFIVNQEGVVYEKDLGKKTASIARRMKAFDPDPTWRKVDSSP